MVSFQMMLCTTNQLVGTLQWISDAQICVMNLVTSLLQTASCHLCQAPTTIRVIASREVQP